MRFKLHDGKDRETMEQCGGKDGGKDGVERAVLKEEEREGMGVFVDGGKGS